jgi:hypothetical protein
MTLYTLYVNALFNTVGQVQHFNNESSALILLIMEISETVQADCRLTTGTVCSTAPKTNQSDDHAVRIRPNEYNSVQHRVTQTWTPTPSMLNPYNVSWARKLKKREHPEVIHTDCKRCE